MRQDAHAAVHVPGGHDDHFLADAMEIQVDRHVAHRQTADRQRFDVDRQSRARDVNLLTFAVHLDAEARLQQQENGA